MFESVAQYGLFAQLPATEDLQSHADALRELKSDERHQELLDHLYSCLSVLDAKSSSLLSFNSIIIAVFAIFLTGGTLSGFERGTVITGMTSVIVSCFLLLSVVWVHWSTTENLRNPQLHGRVLLQVRRTRTIQYRLAWYCSVGSMVALSVFLVARGS